MKRENVIEFERQLIDHTALQTFEHISSLESLSQVPLVTNIVQFSILAGLSWVQTGAATKTAHGKHKPFLDSHDASIHCKVETGNCLRETQTFSRKQIVIVVAAH